MSVHQETLISAPPQQVFELLTKGTLFSAATGQPAEITDREGDSFSLFGGRVEGRQIELVPGQRVVQAWRFGAEHPSPWEPGVSSTARFTLERPGDGRRLVIDHTGIPAEWIEHISLGYPTFTRIRSRSSSRTNRRQPPAAWPLRPRSSRSRSAAPSS